MKTRGVTMVWLGLKLADSGEDGKLEVFGVPLRRELLVKLRRKAQRCKVWFRLRRVERGLMDLAIMVVERVRSVVLARSLIVVVEKLMKAMDSEVAHLMKSVGRPLAQKLSEIAQGWGNKAARLWAFDLGFVQYLAMMQKNLSPILRV